MADRDDENKTERSVPSAAEIFGGLGWIIKPLIILGVILVLVSVGLDLMPNLQSENSDGLRIGLDGIFSGSRDEKLV